DLDERQFLVGDGAVRGRLPAGRRRGGRPLPDLDLDLRIRDAHRLPSAGALPPYIGGTAQGGRTGGWISAGQVEPPTAWTPPSTCRISPVVIGRRSLKRARQALATAVESWMSQPSGARSAQVSSKALNPGIDFAAMVRTGPAATRLTRMPAGPSSLAR